MDASGGTEGVTVSARIIRVLMRARDIRTVLRGKPKGIKQHRLNLKHDSGAKSSSQSCHASPTITRTVR